MKNPLKDILIIAFLICFVWVCVRPVHAAGTGLIPSSKVTPGNPMGYSASVDGAGNVKMSTELMVIPQPAPAGQSVSAGLTALATAAGGGVVMAPEGTFQAVLNNPAGALAAASTFVMAGGTAVSMFNPAIGVPLVAAGLALQGGLQLCQMVGCHFLDGLKKQGVVLDPVTGATAYQAPVAVGGSYIVPGYCRSATDTICPAAHLPYLPNRGGPHTTYMGYSCTGGVPCTIFSSGYYESAWFESSVTFPAIGASPPAVPATQAQLIAAIAAASTAASFKADMLNLGLQNGMAMVAEAQTAQNVQVASAFSQLSSSTDALGNVVQTLARNVTTVAPGANSSMAPVVTNSVQQVTVTNAVPTATTSTTIADPAAAAVAATTGQTPTQDMCLQHPDILACADISNLNDLPAVTPLTSEKNISSLTPVSLGAGLAVCPPPLVLPGMFGSPPMYLDVWKYPCQFAGAIKPINIAVAGMASIFILMGAFRNG